MHRLLPLALPQRINRWHGAGSPRMALLSYTARVWSHLPGNRFFRSCRALPSNRMARTLEPLFSSQGESQLLKSAPRGRVLQGLHNASCTCLCTAQGTIYLKVVEPVSMNAIKLCSCQACCPVAACSLPCFKHLERTVDANEEDRDVGKQSHALLKPLAFQQNVVDDEIVSRQGTRCNGMMVSRDQPSCDRRQIDGYGSIAIGC